MKQYGHNYKYCTFCSMIFVKKADFMIKTRSTLLFINSNKLYFFTQYVRFTWKTISLFFALKYH